MFWSLDKRTGGGRIGRRVRGKGVAGKGGVARFFAKAVVLDVTVIVTCVVAVGVFVWSSGAVGAKGIQLLAAGEMAVFVPEGDLALISIGMCASLLDDVVSETWTVYWRLSLFAITRALGP